MHKKGVIHRDLKPENVLIAHGGVGPSVLLADFGHACGGSSGWHRNNFATTLEYSAPEIWEQGLETSEQRDGVCQRGDCSLSNVYGEATDIWAITIIFLQIILRTAFIPGILEHSVLPPYLMYFGVLNLTSKVEEMIEAAGDLPDPVKSIFRAGFHENPTSRFGPEGSGLQHIVGLAEEWHAKCKLNASYSCQVDTTKVMELLKSATNDLKFKADYGGKLPDAFKRISAKSSSEVEPTGSPPGRLKKEKALVHDFVLKASFESSHERSSESLLRQCFVFGALSPGSMV
jgi:serine/threonine protein kinase